MRTIPFHIEDIPLRLVVLVGGLLTFFMAVMAGAAALAIRGVFEDWDLADHGPRGFFGGIGLGIIALVFVLTMASYAALFFVHRRKSAVLAAIGITLAALLFLAAVLTANWDPFVRLMNSAVLI